MGHVEVWISAPSKSSQLSVDTVFLNQHTSVWLTICIHKCAYTINKSILHVTHLQKLKF